MEATGGDTIHFAIEVNGVVCGYLEVRESPLSRDGRELVAQQSKIFVMLTVLGSRFNSAIEEKALLDAATRRQVQSDIHIDQNGTTYDFSLRTTATEAILRSTLRPESKAVALTPGLLIGNEELFLRVRREFVANRVAEARFDILEPMEEEVQSSRFRKIGEEVLDLAGKKRSCLVIEQVNAGSGLKTTYWLDPACDFFVQFEVNNRKIYLSERRVVDRIKVADMNTLFFTKTNVAIADVPSIRYMKLRAKFEPTGAVLKAEDLSVPGQTFNGTVRGNLVEGVMEIENPRYGGENAPPFPPPFRLDKSLNRYLESDRFIEAADPVLEAKAREITTGARDSWDAATRLSRWVADNIGYAIPGGGTARRTYDLRAGECGSHSMLLAALCRSVGIPARVVFGALYVPNWGGGFGQHAWNEIYMGKAGWIPVDATAGETDFVDSAHIRAMEIRSAASNRFNGKEIEVLEYRLAGRPEPPDVLATLAPCLGSFSHLQKGKTFTVLEKDGVLVLDVPGRMALPFQNPDGRGRWYCKMSPRLYLVFKKDDRIRAKEMVLHEISFLPRSGSAPAAPGTPADLAVLTGNFHAAAVNADLTVFVGDGRLAVYDPGDKTTARFRPSGHEGEWIDDHGFVIISFERDGQGRASLLKIDTADTFVRGELASRIVEKEIAAAGVEPGLKGFRELKRERSEEVLFSEESFNLLAYRLLNAGEMEKALAIFRLNVGEYPLSPNAYGCLAEAYVKNNQVELAIRAYQKALQLDPKSERARKRIAELGGR